VEVRCLLADGRNSRYLRDVVCPRVISLAWPQITPGVSMTAAGLGNFVRLAPDRPVQMGGGMMNTIKDAIS
jgi:hypothetical protein